MRRRDHVAGVLLQRYGAQAHLVTADGLGLALQSASAPPMILGGADVYVARRLVATGL